MGNDQPALTDEQAATIMSILNDVGGRNNCKIMHALIIVDTVDPNVDCSPDDETGSHDHRAAMFTVGDTSGLIVRGMLFDACATMVNVALALREELDD